jgi:hypothetical protein
MIKTLACLWFALMSTAHAGAISKAVASLPNLPVPPQGETEWVARSMRMNGLPMTIQTLVSRSLPDDVIHFYESWAKQGNAQTRQWHTRDAEVLSIRAPSYLVTIELQRVVGGSQGTIVTSPPPEKVKLTATTAFPHPTSWRVANLQQYEDDGKETEHITFTSAHGPMTEARDVLAILAANGWTLVSKRSSDGNNFLAELQRDAELARVVIASDTDRRANTLVAVLWSKGR